MILNDRAIPPAFLVEAVPGAEALRAAAEDARAALTSAREALREAGDAYRRVGYGSLDNPRPKAGVTSASLNEAVDAHRAATETMDDALRGHSRALRRLNDAVRTGMNTEAFKNAHEKLADAAQKRASDALEALAQALTERDDLNASIGRKLDLSSAGPYGRGYHLDGLRAIVNAPVLTDRQRAFNELASSTMTAAQRVEFAKQNGFGPRGS